MTISHLLLPWQAVKQGLITALDYRTYHALHEMAERRRYVPATTPAYREPECQKLLGPAVRRSQVKHAIAALEDKDLVHWSPSELRFATQPSAVPRLDVTAYTAMRAHMHPTRVWFPMARRMLRYQAREGSPGFIVTGLYVAQRCFWDPTAGVYAGVVSPEALAACCDFSERTAARHLAAFERLGWLHWEHRPRWYERAHGRWYVINPAWKAPQHPPVPAPQSRRPRQLSLPLPADTEAKASAKASPPPAPAKAERVEAEPPAAALASPEDGCKKVSGCEGTPCENLSSCTPRNTNNPTDYRCSSPPIPFQEICIKHQIPTPQAAPPLITADPSQALFPFSKPVTGVQSRQETIMRDQSSEKPPPSSETWDRLEARYASFPANRQAALRADAEAHLLQQGYKRAFVTSQLILYEICRRLAVQDSVEVPVAPDSSPTYVPTPSTTPAKPALGPPLQLRTPCQSAPMAPAPIARVPRESPGGGHSLGDGTGERKLPKPTSSHIRLEDLQETARLLLLYPQYVAQGLAVRNPPGLLAFVALAEHALRVGVDPAALFADNLRHQCYHVYSEADDAAAQVRLKALDGIDPQRKRPTPPTASTPSALSKDAWIVREQQRLCLRAGVPVDVGALVRQAYPALSGEEQDRIVKELAQYQRSCTQASAQSRLTQLAMEDWHTSPVPEAVAPCAACGEAGEACGCPEAADLTCGAAPLRQPLPSL